MVNKPIQVIKVGGNELTDVNFMNNLVMTIQEQKKEYACVLVHGGGVAISNLMNKTGIVPQYKDGQRITDEATLEIAEMVLSGKINKQLVLSLNQVGIDAIGLSGVDRSLLQVEPWGDAMDLVGRIVKVRKKILEDYFIEDVITVISPISIGQKGRYNVNADHAAGMIAGALCADEIVFITNVPGVLVDGEIAETLTDKQVFELIEREVISGGMIPKVNAALDALCYGAKQARITNINGFEKTLGTSIISKKDS